MADLEELDRFKRRLIRTVARLKQDNVEDLWIDIEKSMGRNCEPLWSRMRALTLKKLSRLLATGDLPDKLAPVARMSITDWLLLDLVLVHEDIDITDVDYSRNRVAYKCLMTLLALVDTFKLEESTPGLLAQRWAQATVHYNQKGKQCSPMLLQRRWYEVKLKTRASFYKYWTNGFNKGDKQNNKPSEICVKVAQTFPHIVTEVLPTWEELLKNDLIVLPNEFERILQKDCDQPQKPEPSTSVEPDLILIEPVIETIDVDLVSELEEAAAQYQSDNSNDGTPEDQTKSSRSMLSDTHNIVNKKDLNTLIDVPIEHLEMDISNVFIKKEKIDPCFQEPDGLCNVQIVGTTHVVEESKTNNEESDSSNANLSVENNTTLSTETDTNVDIKPNLIPQNMKNLGIELVKDKLETEATDTCLKTSAIPFIFKVESEAEQIVPTLIEETNKIHEKSDESTKDSETTNRMPAVEAVPKDNNSDTETIVRPGPKSKKYLLSIPKSSFTDPALKATENIVMKPSKVANKPGPRCTKNCVYLEDSDNAYEWPETAEDFFSNETVDESKINTLEVDFKKATQYCGKEIVTANAKQATGVEDVTPDFDNATDVDDMDEFNECDLDFADDVFDDSAVHIDDATLKSLEQQHTNIILPEDSSLSNKEVSLDVKPLVFEEAEENDSKSVESHPTPKFDLKLLMLPVVYTLKLHEMELLQNVDLNETVFDKSVSLDAIEALSKAMSNKQAEFNINNDGIEFSDSESDGLDNDEDNYANRSDDIVNDADNESLRQPILLKESSYLFQKPSNRLYTSINLCKNPDFNTRLRRLSVGFLTKSRNRQLLKACKPLTVDLQKVFEQKLVNGIVYLESESKASVNYETIREIYCQSSSVLPSAMATQSLVDKETVDMEQLISNNSLLMARKNKSIVLPDIDKVRQVNRQLLTAEVPPLQTTLNDTTIKIHRSIQGTTAVTQPRQEEAMTTQAVHSVQLKEQDVPKDQEVENIVQTNKCAENNQQNVQDESINIHNMSGRVEYKEDRVTSMVNRIDPSDGKRKFEEKVYQIHRLGLKEVTEKNKDKKKKIISNRTAKTSSQPTPWYMRPSWCTMIKDDRLLQEDALQRMIHELTDGPKQKAGPLRKLSYCCLAKRHKILNNARNRLFINCTGEIKKRRFRNKLLIHTCPTFDSCQCCCKLLIDWPDNEKAANDAEQVDEISEDMEINNAIAELESIIAPKPVTNNVPTVTLAPPMQSFSPKVVKITSKRADTSESTVNIIWSPKQSQSPSKPQDDSKCENENNDWEAERTTKNNNVIDLSADEDLQQSDVIIRNHKYQEYLNSQRAPQKKAIKTKLIPALPRPQRKRGRRRKVYAGRTVERTQQNKAPELAHENAIHDKEPETNKSLNLAPQIPPLALINEQVSQNMSESLMEFPPGTKIILMNDGQVFAVNDDGTPFRMSNIEKVALRDAVYTQLGVSTPVIIDPADNTILQDYTNQGNVISHPNNEQSNEVPVLSISDPEQPIMIAHDTLLFSLGLNTNPQLIDGEPILAHSNYNDNDINRQLIIDEDSGEVILMQNSEQVVAEAVLNQTEGRGEPDISSSTTYKEKTVGFANNVVDAQNKDEVLSENSDRMNVNKSVGDGNEETGMINRRVMEKSETNKETSENIYESAADNNNDDVMHVSKSGISASDSSEDKLKGENKQETEIAALTLGPLISVKNFAKIKVPIEKEQTQCAIKESAEEQQYHGTAAKTSILSDLMEISGISIDDDAIPELNVFLGLPGTSLENEDSSTDSISILPTPAVTTENIPTAVNSTLLKNGDSSTDSISLLQTPAFTTETILTDENGYEKVFMFDPQTGKFNQLEDLGLTNLLNVKKSAQIKKNTRCKRKQTTFKILPDVIELADSGEEETNQGQDDSDIEEFKDYELSAEAPKTSANVAASQLMRLLSKKKKRKQLSNLRHYPAIYMKQKNLKRYIKNNYENCFKAISRIKKKRKENIEVKIDLVDSDAPMEEEYLVDSADTDSEISSTPVKKRIPAARLPVKEIIPLDSDSSSDDEPLAIIVNKRQNTNEVEIEKGLSDEEETPLAKIASKGPNEKPSKPSDDTCSIEKSSQKNYSESEIISHEILEKNPSIFFSKQINKSDNNAIEQVSENIPKSDVESDKRNEELVVLNNDIPCPVSQNPINEVTENQHCGNAEDDVQQKKNRKKRKKDVDSLSNVKYDDPSTESNQKITVEVNSSDGKNGSDVDAPQLAKRKRKKRNSIETTIDDSIYLNCNDDSIYLNCNDNSSDINESGTEEIKLKKRKHLDRTKIKSIDLNDTKEELITKKKLKRKKLTEHSSEDMSDGRTVDSSTTNSKSNAKSSKRRYEEIKTINKNIDDKGDFSIASSTFLNIEQPKRNEIHKSNIDTVAPTNLLNYIFDDPKIGFMWCKRKDTKLLEIYTSMNANNESAIQVDEQSFEKILKRKARGNYTAIPIDVNSVAPVAVRQGKVRKTANLNIVRGIDTSDALTNNVIKEKSICEKETQRKGCNDKINIPSDICVIKYFSKTNPMDEPYSGDDTCDRKKRRKKRKDKNIDDLRSIVLNKTIEEISVNCNKAGESSVNSDSVSENDTRLSQLCDSELRDNLSENELSQDCILGI